MTTSSDLRFRNPFREATSTELIENPETYSRIFSQEILVNETLDVFEKSNIVLTGPQGTGKTMILCLFRPSFLSACLESPERAEVLRNIRPFFGISLNLIRSGFHIFGRRSLSKQLSAGEQDESVDAAAAADYLSHFLFRQFIQGLQFLASDAGRKLREWIGISNSLLTDPKLAPEMARWPCWRGYYRSSTSLEALADKCHDRLSCWFDFLNINSDTIPDEVWRTKAHFEDAVHRMGSFTASLTQARRRLPLYVVFDQYEVLPELNPVYGTSLQRIVNSLIKARDPCAFYKIGARPYDWGKELRVWGAESRIEIDRDYKIVNLTDVLRRGENQQGWLFPRFAEDVAYRRMQALGADTAIKRDHIRKMLGDWSAETEAQMYVGRRTGRKKIVMRHVSESVQKAVLTRCGDNASVLNLRLASAWCLQKMQKHVDEEEIISAMDAEPAPWEGESWRKERVEVALLQIASMNNQRKKYFGWNTILFLSGSDIRAFLRICEEVWEIAAKIAPTTLIEQIPVSPEIQTEGVFEASHRWRARDRTDTHGGGSQRYAVLGRLGPAIHDHLVQDLAISNPGHSGFSLREPDLAASDRGKLVAEFLGKGVNWAIFEERLHTSKEREGATRSKWFLHPVLSPGFGVPFKRVKEPYYATIDEAYSWLFATEPIRIGGHKRRPRRVAPTPNQPELPFGE